jgi:hypothetical protein
MRSNALMVVKKLYKLTLKTILFLILISGIIASLISAVWTIIPDSSSSKRCILGYFAHCSFTPISTIILILITGIFCYSLMRIYKKGNKNE